MAQVIGNLEDVPAGRVVAFKVDGKTVAVANVDGTLYAIDDFCSHRGCSLAEGMLQGTSITCPCHSSVFQVSDGAVLDGPATRAQATYVVEVTDGKIALALTESDPTEASTTAAAPAAPSPGPDGKGQATPRAGAPSDHERVLNALGSVPMFVDLDQDALERLEAFTFRKAFADGEVIVEEGRTGNGLYVVLSGSVEVIKGLGGSRPQKVAVLGAGEPFGEMALLGDWKRSASVQAVGEVECLGMDRWAFLTHLKSEPNLAIRMLQMLANRLMETNQRLVE